jgi:spoIIIJ-associated protein
MWGSKKLPQTHMDTQASISLITELTTGLLSKMGIEQEITVTATDDQSFEVSISGGETAGLLIGKQGMTLQSFQSLINSMYRNKAQGEWKRIIVNVADWKEKEESRMQDLAMATAMRAKQTGEAQTLYNLTPAQRRIVHMALAEDSTVTTTSEGEGKERYLLVTASK